MFDENKTPNTEVLEETDTNSSNDEEAEGQVDLDRISSDENPSYPSEDIELIKQFFAHKSLTISNEFAKELGLIVRRLEKSIEIQIPFRDEQQNRIAVRKIAVTEDGKEISSINKGDYTGECCFKFGTGQDAILFNRIEDAIAWYLNEEEAMQYTYFVTPSWTGFQHLGGFFANYKSRYCVLPHVDFKQKIIQDTECLAKLDIVRLQHPQRKHGAWEAVMADNFSEWRGALQGKEYDHRIRREEPEVLDAPHTVENKHQSDESADATEQETRDNKSKITSKGKYKKRSKPKANSSTEGMTITVDSEREVTSVENDGESDSQEVSDERRSEHVGDEFADMSTAHAAIVECDDLETLEKIIRNESANMFTSSFKVGAALNTIRTKKLYKPNFKTFESYCRKVWDISRSEGNLLSNVFEVRTILSPIGDKMVRTSKTFESRLPSDLDISQTFRQYDSNVLKLGLYSFFVRIVLSAAPTLKLLVNIFALSFRIIFSNVSRSSHSTIAACAVDISANSSPTCSLLRSSETS